MFYVEIRRRGHTGLTIVPVSMLQSEEVSCNAKSTVGAIIAGEPRRATLRNHSIYRISPKELPDVLSAKTRLRAFRLRREDQEFGTKRYCDFLTPT